MTLRTRELIDRVPCERTGEGNRQFGRMMQNVHWRGLCQGVATSILKYVQGLSGEQPLFVDGLASVILPRSVRNNLFIRTNLFIKPGQQRDWIVLLAWFEV